MTISNSFKYRMDASKRMDAGAEGGILKEEKIGENVNYCDYIIIVM